jgi:putative redox protein
MVDIHIKYEGDLRCSAQHGPSHTLLNTDAPVDNFGKGESFSPTDLLATSLGTCMVTTMGIVARKNQWALHDVAVHVKKPMTADPPRKVSRLVVQIVVDASCSAKLDAATRRTLEDTAHTCPVALSLSSAVQVVTQFDWRSV